jgi:hypothetical protein
VLVVQNNDEKIRPLDNGRTEAGISDLHHYHSPPPPPPRHAESKYMYYDCGDTWGCLTFTGLAQLLQQDRHSVRIATHEVHQHIH